MGIELLWMVGDPIGQVTNSQQTLQRCGMGKLFQQTIEGARRNFARSLGLGTGFGAIALIPLPMSSVPRLRTQA